MIRSSLERFRSKIFGSFATLESDKLEAVLRDVSFNAPGSLGRLLRSFSPGHVQLALRSAVKSQYLGNNQILCQILGNKKMFVIGDDLGFSPHMIMEGYWEYWLTKYFAQHIRPGDTVIDIGANLGYYSILAADLVTSTGKVVSIEANPHVFSLLSKSMVLNGYDDRAELHNFALASKDETGTRNFFVPYNEPKNGKLLSENENIKWREKHGDVFKVDLGYLDPNQFAILRAFSECFWIRNSRVSRPCMICQALNGEIAAPKSLKPSIRTLAINAAASKTSLYTRP